MNRHWARALRRHGWFLFGAPLLLVGALFLIFEYFLEDYVAFLEEANNLELRSEQIGQFKLLQPRLIELNGSLKPKYEEMEVRAFRSSSKEKSIVQLESSVKNILQSLYFDEIEIKSQEKINSVRGKDGMILIEANFVGVPQQLNRLEAALAAHQYGIRVNALDVIVENSPTPGVGALRLKAQFIAVHLQTASDPSAINKNDSN